MTHAETLSALPAASTITREDHLVYEISGDSATVISYDGVIDGEVAIPRSFLENAKRYIVTEIAEKAFAGQKGLTKIILPNSVTAIGAGAFDACTSLEGFFVKSGNTKFDSDSDGILYNEDQSVLYRVSPAARTVEVSSNVNKIASGAMLDCSALTSIFIPDTVKEIDENAFVSSKGDALSCPDVVVSIRPGSAAYRYASAHGMKIHIQYQYGDLVTADDKSCTVRITDPGDTSGTADYYRCLVNVVSDVTIPASVTIQGQKYQLAGVAKDAFRNVSNVRKIHLCSNVVSVEKGTFTGNKKKTV